MPKYDIGGYVEPFYRSHQTVSGGRSVVVDLRDGAVVDDNDGMAYDSESTARVAWALSGDRNPMKRRGGYSFLNDR